MKYIVNKSLNIVEHNGEILFNDGRWKKIDFKGPFDLFELLSKFNEPHTLVEVENSCNIAKTDFKMISDYLIANNILIRYSGIQSRNETYFARYSTDSLKEIENLRIMVIGCGTGGSTLVNALAKLGVKTFCLVDDDIVTRHSICAQLVFSTGDIGAYKVDVIADKLVHENPDCKIIRLKERIKCADDFIKILGMMKFDYVINCADEITDDTLIDILRILNLTNCKYINCGYVAQNNLVMFITNYTDYINYILDINEKQKNIRKITSNGGIIVENLLLASVIISLIIKDIVKGLKNTYLQINSYDFIMRNFREKDDLSKKQFIKKIKGLLSKDFLFKNLSSDTDELYTTEFVDSFNLAMFIKRIGLSNNLKIKSITDKLEKEFNFCAEDVLPELKKMFFDKFNQSSGTVFKSINHAMIAVNMTGNKKLQTEIYNFLESNKKDLLNLLEKERKSNQISLLDTNNISYKIITDIQTMRDFEYQTICRKDWEESFETLPISIDFLKYHNFYSYTSIPYNKLIEFIYKLSIYLPAKYAEVVQKFIKSESIYIDCKSPYMHGQTYYSPLHNESLVYVTYDGTYKSLLTVLHELGHYVSNNLIDKENFFHRELLEREILADSFVFFWLNKIESENKTITNLKLLGMQNYLHVQRYVLDTLLFILQLDKCTNEGLKMNKTRYNEAYDMVFKRENLGISYLNKKIFSDNYLANAEIYSNVESTINKLIRHTASVLFSEYIYGKNNEFNSSILEKLFRENNLYNLILRTYNRKYL